LNYTRKRYSYILIKKLAFVNKFFGGYKRLEKFNGFKNDFSK